MLFGIAIGTVSSIMIAAPILLLLGEHRLRRDVITQPGAANPATPPAKVPARSPG
jgi:preprotein translocase subunit SecD/preprotein translocase subunit SecF